PLWLKVACDEEAAGVKEISGRPSNNPRILEYLGTAKALSKIKDVLTTRNPDGTKVVKETGYMMSQVDETAWCACFVNWCLLQAGETPLAGAVAQAYAAYGKQSTDTGSICVIKREPFNDSSSGSHVGFYIGGDAREGYVALLGGNQNNSVCRKWFVGIEPAKIWQRWPA
ncbi:MAG TPA: TIGR02594 family protein, partial [Polyangiaceae bacterium]|nr:TIGR02594 family protein [Polyangiaceae bacterium]